jgi:hypothetical protein
MYGHRIESYFSQHILLLAIVNMLQSIVFILSGAVIIASSRVTYLPIWCTNGNIFNSMTLGTFFWEAKRQTSCGVRRKKTVVGLPPVALN